MATSSEQQGFIEFMVRAGVLTFGDFVTKSGRRTPFFINTGNYDSGARLLELGRAYGRAIMTHLGGEQFDCLFGPAYKGIPLVTTTACALAQDWSVDVPVAFNRKEAKDHGEGGAVIGHVPQAGERVLVIDDVTTSGASVRESIELLARAAPGARVVAAVVSVDRMERGQGAKSALQELRDDYGLDAFAIVTIEEVVQALHNRPVDGRVVVDDAMQAAIEQYRAQYGV